MNPDLGFLFTDSGKIYRLLLGLAAALGIWLGFPNNLLEFPPAVFLWPVCLFFLGKSASSPKKALLYGWLCTCAGQCAALYWLSYPVHYVGELYWPAAYCCALFICACLSTQGAIFCALAWFSRNFSPLCRAIFLSLAWYLLEYGYAAALGFPWLPISGAISVWPVLLQAADIFGAYLLSAVWLAAILLLLPAGAGKFGRYASICCGLVLGAALLLYGYVKLEQNPRITWPEGAESMAAIFVEGNIDQNEKWVPAFQRATLDRYIALSLAGVRAGRKLGMENPLVIWPETALPFFFERNFMLSEDVRDLARKLECPILFGAPGVVRLPGATEDAVYNRAFLMAPGGQIIGWYDKEHLVPFGEYLPEWLNWPFLEKLLQGVGIYHEGTDTAPLRYGRFNLGMLICYEGIFPQLAQQRVEQGANILVDISNDGWFFQSPASRQHLYLTLPRCIEQNRWLLRATNTGISAVCDERGRIIMAGPQFKAEYLPVRGKLLNKNTFYHKVSTWLPAGALVAFLLTLVPCLLKRKSNIVQDDLQK